MENNQKNPQPKKNYGSVLLVFGLAGLLLYFGWDYIMGLGVKPIMKGVDPEQSGLVKDTVK